MEAFPQWIIILIGTIILSRVVAHLARRFGLPGISMQLLVGILLGSSVLNLLGVPMVLGTWGSPSSGPLHAALKILAEIGLIQLMFLAGMMTDWRQLKTILKPSFSVGAWGFGLTAVIVAILTRLFVDRWSEALGMSAILSASSFGISIYGFSERNGQDSQGAVILSGAAILSGLLAILLMIASQAANYVTAHGAFKMTIAVSWFLAKLVMYFAIAYFLTSRFLKLGAKTGFLKRPRQMLIGYLLLVSSLYAWAAMHFGSFAAVGVASLGGTLLGISNREVKEKIGKGFESILASIPVGILLMVIGMGGNLKAPEGSIIFLIVLLATVIGAKLVAVLITRHRANDSLSDRLVLTIGILPQGEMGILIAAYLFSRGLLNPSSFHSAITVVILLTMITPVVMKAAQIKFSTRVNGAPHSPRGEKGHRWP